MEKREKIAQMQILDQEIAQKAFDSGQVMIRINIDKPSCLQQNAQSTVLAQCW